MTVMMSPVPKFLCKYKLLSSQPVAQCHISYSELLFCSATPLTAAFELVDRPGVVARGSTEPRSSVGPLLLRHDQRPVYPLYPACTPSAYKATFLHADIRVAPRRGAKFSFKWNKRVASKSGGREKL